MGRKFAGYENGLFPSFSFLSDKAVIIQAWKKSHEYIRRHNWYSDNLELDISCINLESLYLEIATLFSKDNWRQYRPTPLRLVPAPKPPKENEKWEVGSSRFKVPSQLTIRPLAHITIKDQTISMMFLMCLANIFETLQGRPVEYSSDTTQLAVSYGNRLLCSWEKNQKDSNMKAFFFWGNAETYNRYYKDYQAFISRPEKKLQTLTDSQKERNKYFIVSLDLSKCYDRVNRKELIRKVESRIPPNPSGRKFISCFKKMIAWEWANDDQNLIAEYQRSLNPNSSTWTDGADGIPQGLVISGFLANIYMLDFDTAIQQNINSQTSIQVADCSISIIDYCRYVDDMRLILELHQDTHIDTNTIQEKLTNNIQSLLDKYATGQQLHHEKTMLLEVNFSENFNLIAEQIKELKFRTSGPMDEHNAWEVLKLNKNIWEQTGENKNIPVLHFGDIKIEPKPLDVKQETLERFSAYNWHKVYRTLALLLPAKEGNGDLANFFDYPCSRETLDYMTDDFCQKVFFRWLNDPSKIRILRISLDICPNVDYLKIILELLCDLIKQEGIARTYAFYILSELYRAGAVETGFVHLKEQIPNRYNIEEYRQCLLDGIPQILAAHKKIPWYLANQIALFCFMFSSKDNCLEEVLPHCDPIYNQCYSYFYPKQLNSINMEFDLAPLIIAYRIKKDKDILAAHAQLLSKVLQEETSPKRNQLVTFIDDIDLCNVLGNFSDLHKGMKSKIHLQAGVKIPLADIVQAANNPFVSEVSIIRLGRALCQFFKNKPNISQKRYYVLNQLCVTAKNWENINNPSKSVPLTITIRKDFRNTENFLFVPEKWEDHDFSKLSQVGKLLRASILGEQEYSLMRRKSLSIYQFNDSGNGPSRYWGIRSSWLKRHYGLFFDRVVLGGTHVPISPWVTQLFSSILAWPGAWSDEQFENLQFDELEGIFTDRLNELKKYYGKASGTPIIPVDIDLKNFTSDDNVEKLNVALVQNIFPTKETLQTDHTLIDPCNRRIAHSHLSDLLQMLLKTFKTHSSLTAKSKSINLIVFPELAIQESDLLVLERFADKMNSIIFCGMIFHRHPEDNDKTVNTGMWIIPQRKDDRRSFIRLLQGKQHLTEDEIAWGITSYRPVQWLIRGFADNELQWTMSASICYDATDIKLSADLRDIVDCYIVSAFNKDIGVFDTMAEAMRYHMFNHTVITNSGYYGGSTIQAPYAKSYERILVHTHGKMQATIALKTLSLKDFDERNDNTKTPPAGYIKRKK